MAAKNVVNGALEQVRVTREKIEGLLAMVSELDYGFMNAGNVDWELSDHLKTGIYAQIGRLYRETERITSEMNPKDLAEFVRWVRPATQRRQ